MFVQIPPRSNGEVEKVSHYQDKPQDDVEGDTKCLWCFPCWKGQNNQLSGYHKDKQYVYLLLLQNQTEHASSSRICCHLKGELNFSVIFISRGLSLINFGQNFGLASSLTSSLTLS